jgi:hypothetical protein
MRRCARCSPRPADPSSCVSCAACRTRILAVADVVEAMSSQRPYRPALGLEQALAEIETGRGIVYDADVTDACGGLFQDGFSFS